MSLARDIGSKLSIRFVVKWNLENGKISVGEFKMALTREDLQSLLRWLDEDPEFRAALRQKLFAEPLIIEVRLPTDWMAKVDSRLERLEQDVGTLKQDVGTLKQDVGTLKQDVGTLKQDVGTLKQDVGTLKGKVLEVDRTMKAANIFGLLLRNGRSASEFVSSKLDEAESQGILTPQEADFVMAADLLWMGVIRRGKFTGETLVLIGEISWTIERDDVERAVRKAEILRKVGIWAVPFVSGSEWVDEKLREDALKQNVLCVVDGRIEPSRADWEQLEQILAYWKP